jgi:hypothetical protein
MLFISREQWENIDRAIAEGKKKSEAIIASIEGTDAGDRFLRMNVPLENLPQTSE